MSTIQQLLTNHIDIWTAAETEKKSGRGRASSSTASVYGIKKLRELILELAVRGKLVPQDANDEPASELLKRIQAEKSKFFSERKLKDEKPVVAKNVQEKPFGLPATWEYVRFGVVANTRLGKMLDQVKNKGIYRPYLRNTNVQWSAFELDDLKEMRFEEHELDEYRVIAGDLVICEGGEPGRCAIWEDQIEEMFIQKALHRARPWTGISSKFLQFCFSVDASNGRLSQFFTGATIKHFPGEKLNGYSIPLPPTSEQHRIVAKVDELMALCDKLESQHSKAADAHEQLVSHLLCTLTQSQSAADFNTNWQRIASHFDTLFTTEISIDALKQTLLQLAVMGKLVAQDADEEPASELLKQIQAEKAKLVAEGKIKKDKLFTPSVERQNPYSVPLSWKWITLDEISQVGTGATPLRTTFEYFNPPSVSWVTSGETSNSFIFETEQYVSPLALKETNLTLYPRGTLIVAMYGQGKTRGQITELMIDACTNQACAAIQLHYTNEHHRKYVKLFFEKIYDEIRQLAAGGAQPNLNLSKIKETLLPLPPLLEQYRIVAKIDELMALCDQVRSFITAANQHQKKLADVFVEHAVIGEMVL